MKDHKVNLDSILINDLGQFGRYQLLTLALAALPTFFWAYASGEYVFTTARIPSRCLVPECDYETPVFAAPWRDYAIPKLQSGGFDQCSRFAANSSVGPQPLNGTCSANIFDCSTTEACENYVYQNNFTIVHEFDLGCDEWRRSFVGSIRSVGTLFALPITAYVSDRWGRRVALALTAFNTGWLGLARSFATSYEWLLALVFIEATFGSASYSTCTIIIMELVGPKKRVLAGTLLSTMLSLGHASLGLIAWSVPYWRTLTQILFAPQLLFITYFWIMSESIRWLMSKGRHKEVEEILKKVAVLNRKTLSEKSMIELRRSAESEKNVVQPKEPWLLMLVFRSREMLKRCCITPVWWLTNMLVLYGMRLNAVNLSGNSYLNYSIVALIEIPGRWTAFLLLDRVGRRSVIAIAFCVCGACQFIFAFLPEGRESLSLAVYMSGMFCVAALVVSVQVYTAELYPTKYRHNLFAFPSMVGRLGTILAPLTPALSQEVWAPLPSVMFGSLALLSALLVVATPETLGTSLPDTIEDAEIIGKTKS